MHPWGNNMRRFTLVAVALILVLLFVLFATRLSGQKTNMDDVDVLDPTDVTGSLCDVTRRYERRANHQDGCSCPEGYWFQTDVIGYDQCAGPGSECPILEVWCVPA
jgi:hypothetical protein